MSHPYVSLSSLAFHKLQQHALENPLSIAFGKLVGLDSSSVVEVTSAFGLPSDEDTAPSTVSSFDQDMLRYFKTMNMDYYLVGWYVAVRCENRIMIYIK